MNNVSVCDRAFSGTWELSWICNRGLPFSDQINHLTNARYQSFCWAAWVPNVINASGSNSAVTLRDFGKIQDVPGVSLLKQMRNDRLVAYCVRMTCVDLRVYQITQKDALLLLSGAALPSCQNLQKLNLSSSVVASCYLGSQVQIAFYKVRDGSLLDDYENTCSEECM